MEFSIFEVLDGLKISTFVVFSGAVQCSFNDVPSAAAYVRRQNLDKKCRVTRHFTFWSGYFAVLRLEWRHG